MNNQSLILIGDELASFEALKSLIENKNIKIEGYCATSPEKSVSSIKLVKYSKIPLLNFKDLSLLNKRPDYIINVFSTKYLKQDILKQAKNECFNFHPGLLPAYGGLHVHQWAIRNNEEKTGITCHKMAKKIDTGDILFRSEIPLTKRETGISLYIKLSKLIGKSVADFCKIITENKFEHLNFIKQTNKDIRIYTHDEALKSQIKYSWNLEEFESFIRAAEYGPFNSPTYEPSITLMNQKIKFKKYEILKKITIQENFQHHHNENAFIEDNSIYISLKDVVIKVSDFKSERIYVS